MRPVSRRRLSAFLRAGLDISLLNWLRIVWLATVFWFEFGIYEYSLAICGWRDKLLSRSAIPPTHVLLVTDPQVRNVSSRKHGLLSRFNTWLYHAGLRKSWKYASQMRPDAVFFLGDILASGRKIKDDIEYADSVERFRSIFFLKDDVNAYFVPGNEDVGLNLQTESARQTRRHYVQHFGPVNNKVSIANHTFVMLDAPALVEEDYERARHLKSYDEWKAERDGPVEFIRTLRDSRKGLLKEPIILLTHIPLARSDTATCGPLREHGTIRKGAGPGYQNTLGKLTTQYIFENLRPALVFSGDDRDYCDYTHVYTQPANLTSISHIREVTVKSFSPYKSIRYPGFHLLSLIPPHGVANHLPDAAAPVTFSDHPCFFPSQSNIYNAVYFPLTVVTLIILLIAKRLQPRMRYQPLLPSNLTSMKHTGSPPPHAITYTSEYSEYEKHGSTSLLSSPEMNTPTSSTSPARGAQRRLWPWKSSFSRGRSRQAKSRLSYGWCEVDNASSRLNAITSHWLSRALRTAFLSFLSATLPSLALWILIVWWTLR